MGTDESSSGKQHHHTRHLVYSILLRLYQIISISPSFSQTDVRRVTSIHTTKRFSSQCDEDDGFDRLLKYVQQFMCFTNSICQTSPSTMNDSSSSSSSPPGATETAPPPAGSRSLPTDKSPNHDSDRSTEDDKVTSHILDVIFDYMANGEDELTLRLARFLSLNDRLKMLFLY